LCGKKQNAASFFGKSRFNPEKNSFVRVILEFWAIQPHKKKLGQEDRNGGLEAAKQRRTLFVRGRTNTFMYNT
jgi:hypothetical protein